MNWNEISHSLWEFVEKDKMIGYIIKRNDRYYSFYKGTILSGYDTLQQAKSIVEDPTIDFNKLMNDDKYTVKP